MNDISMDFSPEIKAEWAKLESLPDSAIKEELKQKLLRMAKGEYDYFDWNGIPVRVSCSAPTSYKFENNQWVEGGPGYTARLEEADPLSKEVFLERFAHILDKSDL